MTRSCCLVRQAPGSYKGKNRRQGEETTHGQAARGSLWATVTHPDVGHAGGTVCYERVVNTLRRAEAALLVGLSILLLGAGRHPARGGEPAATAEPERGSCRRSAFRVVVDVGHTREVPGAVSARGVPEYTFNLQLGTEIRQALVDAGFKKAVLLITAAAPPLGLVERAARANGLRADLFISVHHDSVPVRLLETWQYQGRENHFSDRFTGYAIFMSDDNADRAGSLQFGRFLGRELQARGLHYTPHYTLPLMGKRRRQLLDAAAGVYRYDQLIVLRESRMPAVLLEAGSIVNRQEEVELASRERRALVGAAVAAAVEDFCAARPHPKIVPVKRPSSAGPGRRRGRVNSAASAR